MASGGERVIKVTTDVLLGSPPLLVSLLIYQMRRHFLMNTSCATKYEMVLSSKKLIDRMVRRSSSRRSSVQMSTPSAVVWIFGKHERFPSTIDHRKEELLNPARDRLDFHRHSIMAPHRSFQVGLYAHPRPQSKHP
eukprot:scaffold2072_cov162-Amphora_coffeaeformis.AAC.18